MVGEVLLAPLGEIGLTPDGEEAIYTEDHAGCDCCVDAIRVTLSGIQLCDGTYRDSTRADFDFYFAQENFPLPCCTAIHVDGECESGEEWIVSSSGINGVTFTVPRVTADGVDPQQWIGTFTGPSALAVQRLFRLGTGTPIYHCDTLGPRDDVFPSVFTSLRITVTRRLRAGLGIYEWSAAAAFVNGNVSFNRQVFSRVLFQQPIVNAPSTFTIQGEGLASSCVLRTPFIGLQSHSVIAGFSGLCPPGAVGCPLSFPAGYQDFYRHDDGGFAMRLSRGFGSCTIEL